MILDTNALSALVDGDERLAVRLAETPMPAIPVIVLGEYRYGIRRSRHRTAYESWLDQHLQGFAVLSVDAATAVVYADLRDSLRSLGKPIPENDLWIAAISVQHRLPLMSRDGHFADVPNLQWLHW